VGIIFLWTLVLAPDKNCHLLGQKTPAYRRVYERLDENPAGLSFALTQNMMPNEIQVEVKYDAEFNVILQMEDSLALYLQMEQNFLAWEESENEHK
jgi:hypothetical protein